MKRPTGASVRGISWMSVALFCAASLSGAATAGGRDDYVRQWPLQLQGADAGAYRVVLDAAVYRSATSPSLRDIDVFNGDGQSVPAAVFAPEVPTPQQAPALALPWFPLPRDPAAQSGDITLISERATDGSLKRVETRVAGTGAASATALPANAWLIDASAVRRGVMVALYLDWPATAGAIDVGYRVEGSDDLRTWQTLQPHVQLIDLPRDGQRLLQRRVPLEGQSRYLRLTPERADAALPLSGVRVELLGASRAEDWRSEVLQGRAVSAAGKTWYEFTLDGRFPIARADIPMAGNALAVWTLQSRDSKDAPWQTRADPWVAFRVGGGQGGRSFEEPLREIVRDRYWRLIPHAPVDAAAAAPSLRLGYRPEAIVFVAQGKPPYALAAGSANAARAQTPLTQLIDTVRVQRGDDWRPAPATLGAVQALSGERALVPAPPQRDWKAWLLWALLIGGVLVVSWLALSLLRGSGTAATDD